MFAPVLPLKKICLLSVITMLLVSCRDLKDVQLLGVKGFQVNSISTAGIDGSIMLGIRNPNNFGFSILKSEFDVRYSGIYLGKAKLHKKVRIKANSEETYAFQLKSDFSGTNLLDVLKLLKGASFKNELEVKGNLRAGKLLLRKNLPVDLKESIKLN